MMKNPFYFLFHLKGSLYLKYFSFDFCGYVGKWLDKKAKVNFNIYNVTNWEINNCNTHIAQYFKK